MSVGGVRRGGAVTAGGLQDVLAKLGKASDAHVAKMDTNKDGKIDKKELDKWMTRFTKWNTKFEKEMSKFEETDMNKPDAKAQLRKQMDAVRGKMTDSQRMDMAVGSAVATINDNGEDTVSVKTVQAAVRKGLAQQLDSLRNPKGGLEGALGAMFAGIMLPTDAFKFATGHH